MGAAIAAAAYARRAAVATEGTVAIAQDAADGASEALETANRNADAAVALVRTSQSNAVAQLRAYITLKEVNVEILWDYEGPGRTPDAYVFYCVWENGGVTPAINACSEIHDVHFIGSIPRDFDYPNVGESDFSTRITIGPGGPCTIPVRLDVDRLFRDPNQRTLIYGWIEYDDIAGSGQRHRSEFCREIIRAPHLSKEPMIQRQIGPFNGIDDTCYRQPQT